MVKYFWVPFLFLLLSSCSQPKMLSREKLVNHLDNTTVALVTPDGDHAGHIYCTAVWINQNTLLTAGHCVLSKSIDEDGLETKTVDKETYYSFYQEITEIDQAPTAIHHGHQIKLDTELDLAIIRCDGLIPTHPIAKLAKKTPEIGEEVFAVGHVRGMTYSFRPGIVSSYRKMIPERMGPFMQLDAPLYYGDSGGGIFNKMGELVGTVSSLLPSPNAILIIHLDTIKEFVGPLGLSSHSFTDAQDISSN